MMTMQSPKSVTALAALAVLAAGAVSLNASVSEALPNCRPNGDAHCSWKKPGPPLAPKPDVPGQQQR